MTTAAVTTSASFPSGGRPRSKRTGRLLFSGPGQQCPSCGFKQAMGQGLWLHHNGSKAWWWSCPDCKDCWKYNGEMEP